MNTHRTLLRCSVIFLLSVVPSASAASWEAELLFGPSAAATGQGTAPPSRVGIQGAETSSLGAGLTLPDVRQHNYRKPYTEAGIRGDLFAKQAIAETIGEEGAGVSARSRGYLTVLRNGDKLLRTGADRVCLDPKTGELVVIEAKGGTSQLGSAYGYPQGSPEWVVEQAKSALRSSKASLAEKQAARTTLEGAAKGKLRVEVVRTEHVQGEPKSPVVEQTTKVSAKASKMAKNALTELKGDLPDPPKKPVWSPGMKRVAKNTAIAVGVVTAISGTINGYRYATGQIPGEEALFNTATDGGLGGAGYLAAEGVLKIIGGQAHLVLKVGAGAGTARFVFESGRDILDVVRGETSPGELKERIGEDAVKALMTGAGTAVILLGFSNPGTATILIVAVGVAITADIAYDAIAPVFQRESEALQAYFDGLPAGLRNVCPLEWLSEKQDMELFGSLYGPRLRGVNMLRI